MAGINQIKDLGKAGRAVEAYNLAKADLNQGQPWSQLTTGWALRYLIEEDARSGCYDKVITHLDELQALDQIPQDEIDKIYENINFWIGYLAKKSFSPTGFDTPTKLSALFNRLKDKSFASGRGYSMLLGGFIRCTAWHELPDFLDWWNLDKLAQEDYIPYRTEKGKTLMSLAERAFIAKSKALLRLNDLGRIEEFLPQLDTLMTNHTEMTYPGYFYGKLLLSLGATPDDALKVIIPFARKKSSEFWVWQLISDVFVNDSQKQLACLLRAVHCHTQENFLCNIRIKLAQLYETKLDYNRARHHIDIVTRTFAKNGWPLRYELDMLIHRPWINTSTPDASAPIDYKSITDEILCEGTEEAIAIVTSVDTIPNKVTLIYGLIYGKEKRMKQKLRFKVGKGTVLKINYITETDGKYRILSARQTSLPNDLDYAKIVEGEVIKRTDKDFAFLKTANGDFYISSQVVRKYNIQNKETIKSLVVYEYNRKKEAWDWTCVSINKKNN